VGADGRKALQRSSAVRADVASRTRPWETLRILRTGVVDVTETYGGYVAGELPLVEIDPGLEADRGEAAVHVPAIALWLPNAVMGR
jgi:hypothetical protein